MEEIDKYEGITHKIIIPDGVSDSLQFAVLTCFMINTSALLKVDNETSKHDFLNFIGKRLNKKLNDFQSIFKTLKKKPIEEFPKMIPELIDHKHIFLVSNLLFTDTPDHCQMYLLSKTLNIMIIIKQENMPDVFYCCSESKKLMKILIIQEADNYFPGVNFEDLESGNVFYNYETKPLDENKIIYKLFKKNLKKIINSVDKPQRDQLIGLIKGKKDLSFSEKSLSSLEINLGKKNICENHKNKAILPCGTKHCKSCLENQIKDNNMVKCSCGFDFSSTFLINVTTAPKTTFKKVITAPTIHGGPSITKNTISKELEVNKNITIAPIAPNNITNPPVEEPKKEIYCFGCWEILVGKGFSTCPDHFICEKCSKEINNGGVICVVCEFCPDHIYFPRAVNMDGKYAHNECYQNNKPILQEVPVYNCWSCLELFQESNIIQTCGSEHFLCNNCSQYFENVCSPCFNLWCAVCNKLILKPFAIEYNGMVYHNYCTQ